MASLPARQPSQQRASASEQSQAPTSEARESRSQARSQSEDSRTIFVQKPEDESQLRDVEPRPDVGDEDDLKKCWICMSDESEDTPETSQWRDPCPCALVAHEDCLLDWIADIEASKDARNRGLTAPRIECPQCKAEIQLSRPRDYLVEAVKGLDRLGNRAVIPVSGLALTSAMVQLSQTVGVHTIYALFGAEDGDRLLEPFWRITTQPYIEVYAGEPDKVWELLSHTLLDRLSHWRLIVGLPLIAPVLVLSRTSLADSVLPVLPIVFFATQAHSPGQALEFGTWPPSASFAYAVLPYVRGLYNAYYKRVWSERERQWLEAVKPRVSQQNEEDAARDNGQHPAENPGGGENIFEVRIDHDVWGDDWEEEEERLVQQAADRQPEAQPDAPRPHEAQLPEAGGADQHNVELRGQEDAPQRLLPEVGGFPRNEAAPAPVIRDGRVARQPGQQRDDGQQAGAAAPQNAANVQNVERRLSFSPTGIAETFLGALFFPTIAGLSGEALKLILPYTWTNEPSVITSTSKAMFGQSVTTSRYAWTRGFFQKKWARSLVGGCLFVVCKDAIMLYVRWKAAQLHKRRRVVDVDRRKGRGSFRSE
ncbi:putative Zinc finger, RING-CH-type, Zinc finger, RING/FYVE/PHD-type, FANCL domain-containing protein [Septoria linicola]|nr:putative Zinc finger, RING-CH-type, Zinc finger, RING/FYVE/PHD-type, FANCL domain-containing protein [Septoria linicola]